MGGYWNGLTNFKTTRRRVLQTGAATGISAAVLALLGCGGGSKGGDSGGGKAEALLSGPVDTSKKAKAGGVYQGILARQTETLDTQAAKSRKADILLCDTAGRLQNKVNLMKELEKVKRVIEREIPGAPHEVLLVLDATTGQNAMIQAKTFKEATDVSGIVLTKLDGNGKGRNCSCYPE